MREIAVTVKDFHGLFCGWRKKPHSYPAWLWLQSSEAEEARGNRAPCATEMPFGAIKSFIFLISLCLLKGVKSQQSSVKAQHLWKTWEMSAIKQNQERGRGRAVWEGQEGGYEKQGRHKKDGHTRLKQHTWENSPSSSSALSLMKAGAGGRGGKLA